MTSSLTEFLDIQKEMLESQLKVIYRHQRKPVIQRRKLKRTSNLKIVEDVLGHAGKPLHVSKIIEAAKNDFNVTIERDSIVSALIKKINAGKTFVRIAPNTFALKTESPLNGGE